MKFYLCSVNGRGLLSYNSSERKVYVQDMAQDYDIHSAIRFSNYTENAEISDKLWMYVGPDMPDRCIEAPSQVVDLIFEGSSVKSFDSGALCQNVTVLDIAWAASEGVYCGLGSFLNFFPAGSVLSFDGEYGTEIVCFLPFIKFLYDNGHLSDRRLATHLGMEPYYFFMPFNKILKRVRKRFHINPKYRFPVPNPLEHSRMLAEYNTGVDFRSAFREGPSIKSLLSRPQMGEKPIIFIQNKFTVEWMEGPINYFPLLFLQLLFLRYRDRYDFVYSRPGIKPVEALSSDENDFCTYPDLQLVRQCDVPCLELISGPYNYNELKLRICAQINRFVTVQGGGSFLFAMFPYSEVHILHKRGDELGAGSYATGGFFSHLSADTNTTHVYQDKDELWRGLHSFL